MKRLQALVSRSNLSTYIDLFINHGKNYSFPWLIAHHFYFFGNFDNLSYLDVLLKYRRGFNIKIGSRRRKYYFSDVNRIVTSFNERQIFCCQQVRTTDAFNATVCFKDCTTSLHKVAENEGVSIMYDYLDVDLDISEDSRKKASEDVRLTILNEQEVKNYRYKGVLTKLLQFSGKSAEDLFEPEVIKKIKKDKIEREVKTEILNQELEDIKKKVKAVPPFVDLVYEPMLGKEHEDRYENFLNVAGKFRAFCRNYDYACEPMICIAELYEQDPVNFFDSKKDYISEKIDDYLARRIEKGFYLYEEIEHHCKVYYLQERLHYYNKKNNEKNQIREEALKIKKEGGKFDRSKAEEFKVLKEICDSLRKEVLPMMEHYKQIEENFLLKENLMKPAFLKQYINFHLNRNDESKEYWLEFNRGDEDRRELIAEYLDQLISRVKKHKEGSDSTEFFESVKKIYDEERDYVLAELNKNQAPDKDLMLGKYSSIVKMRADYLKMKAKEGKAIFNKAELHLSAYEEAIFDKAVKRLIERETEFEKSKTWLDAKQTQFIDCKQNRRIYKRDHDVDTNLTNAEWSKALFEIHKMEFVEEVDNYNLAISTFEELVGLSPYGLIIGGRVGSEKITSKNPIKLVGNNMTSGYLHDIKEMAYGSIKGESSLESVDASYLRAAVRGLILDLDANRKDRLKKLQEVETQVRTKINLANERSNSEMFYDLLNQNTDKEICIKVPMNIKSSFSNKIERELEAKTIKRKKADELFKEIVFKTAINSKNRYEELEIEETIKDVSDAVDFVMENEMMPYSCFDFKRYRKFESKKNDVVKCSQKYDLDVRRECNRFVLENNGLANKKYDVAGSISYIKLLIALRTLKLTVNEAIYHEFGFKKCQSNYIKSSLAKLIEKMMLNYSIKVAKFI